MPTIVLTGGGTAGHVMPNLALINDLFVYFDKLFYFGSDGIEKKIVEKTRIPFYYTTVIKFDRDNFFKNFKIPFLLKKGTTEALEIFEKIKPDIVFSKGGYASLPACFAAKKMRIPVVVHESDYSFGLANKLVSRFASKVLTSFPETPGGKYIGNPVREEFIYPSKRIPAFLPTLDPGKRTILFCGGSTGASVINNVLYSSLHILLKNYNIIHISGKSGDFNVKKKNYIQYPYSDNFPSLLAYCDMVVCRSGSNTLFETATLGKRCLTIPLPKGTSRGDQVLNAKSFEKMGYCEVLLQDNLNTESLVSAIEALWYKTPKLMDTSKINENIVKEIVELL